MASHRDPKQNLNNFTLYRDLNEHAHLKSWEFQVAMCLARHRYEPTGQCNPGEGLIQYETRKCERSVRYALRSLLEKGVIQRVIGTGERHRGSHYVFEFDENVLVFMDLAFYDPTEDGTGWIMAPTPDVAKLPGRQYGHLKSIDKKRFDLPGTPDRKANS